MVSPLNVVKRLLQLGTERGFWLAVGNSCLHIFCGLLLGVFSAPFCCTICPFFLFLKRLFPGNYSGEINPGRFLYHFGIGLDHLQKSFCFISSLLVFPLMYTNVLQGVRNTDPKLLEMAEVYQMGYAAKLRYLYIPQVLPYFFSACITGGGLCVEIGIAAEILAVPKKYGRYDAVQRKNLSGNR